MAGDTTDGTGSAVDVVTHSWPSWCHLVIMSSCMTGRCSCRVFLVAHSWPSRFSWHAFAATRSAKRVGPACQGHGGAAPRLQAPPLALGYVLHGPHQGAAEANSERTR